MVWSQKALDKKHMDLYSPAAGKTTPKLHGNLGQHKITIISQLHLSGLRGCFVCSQAG